MSAGFCICTGDCTDLAAARRPRCHCHRQRVASLGRIAGFHALRRPQRHRRSLRLQRDHHLDCHRRRAAAARLSPTKASCAAARVAALAPAFVAASIATAITTASEPAAIPSAAFAATTLVTTRTSTALSFTPTTLAAAPLTPAAHAAALTAAAAAAAALATARAATLAAALAAAAQSRPATAAARLAPRRAALRSPRRPATLGHPRLGACRGRRSPRRRPLLSAQAAGALPDVLDLQPGQHLLPPTRHTREGRRRHPPVGTSAAAWLRWLPLPRLPWCPSVGPSDEPAALGPSYVGAGLRGPGLGLL